MARLNLTPRLTQALPQQQARQIAQSYEGQAHFAGTGPDGEICRNCAFWAPFGHSHYATRGTLKPQPCAKFKHLTGKLGPDVPHDARACRHFERNPKPPRVAVSRR